MEPIRQRFARSSALLEGVILISATSLIFSGCKKNSIDSGDKFDMIEVPAGFKITNLVRLMKLPNTLLSALIVGITLQATSCKKDNEAKPDMLRFIRGKKSVPAGCPACGMG